MNYNTIAFTRIHCVHDSLIFGIQSIFIERIHSNSYVHSYLICYDKMEYIYNYGYDVRCCGSLTNCIVGQIIK